MVTILEQPWWNVGTYVEAYSFTLPCAIPDLLVRIEAFYRWRQLREFVREARRLIFKRGSLGGTWFVPDQRFQRQEVEIAVTEDPLPTVICSYTVFDWGPNIHIPPRTLEDEVKGLEHLLLTNAHRS